VPTQTPTPTATPTPEPADSDEEPDDSDEIDEDDENTEPDETGQQSAIDNLPSEIINGTSSFRIGSGSVVVSIDCIEYDESSIISIECSANLIRAVLSPSELARVEAGESAEIRLTIRRIYDTDEVPDEDKDSVENAIEGFSQIIEGLRFGKYHTITKQYRIGGGEWKPITQLYEEVTLIIEVPEYLRQAGAKYYLIRVHDGHAVMLYDHDDDPNTITIKTSQFSTYALALTSQSIFGRTGINDTGRNAPGITIGNTTVLLFAPFGSDLWSPLNLLICIIGILLAVLLMLRFILLKRRERKQDKQGVDITDMSIIVEDRQQYLIWFIIAVVAAMVGAFLFALVQNMNMDMALIDFWTITHTIILAAQVTAIILVTKMVKRV